MLKAHWNRLFSTDFNRNVGILVSGSVIAQAIPVIAYPFLTRIFDPTHFGTLAMYVSLTSVLSVAVTGRYELAIMNPDDDDDAINLTALSVFFSLIGSLIILVLALFFQNDIAMLLGNEHIAYWLPFVSLSVLLLVLFQSFNYWANRMGQYKRLAVSRIIQSSGITFSQILLGLQKAGVGSLIFGRIIGIIASVIMLVSQSLRERPQFIAAISRERIRKVATEYAHFPRHLIYSNLIGTINSQFPGLIIAKIFDTHILGLYSLGYQLVFLPSIVISKNLGDVFRQRATEVYRQTGKFDDILINTLKKSFTISIVPFSIFFAAAPWIFETVFGPEWVTAGDYSRIVAVSGFFSFVITPIDKAAIIVEKTGYIVFLNSFRFVMNVVGIILTWWLDLPIELYLWILVFINVLIYLIELLVCYRFSLNAS